MSLTPICFSPEISKWPLGSTPVTVAVIVPVKALVFSVLPEPSNLLLEVPLALARLSVLDGRNGTAVTLADTVPPLSMLLLLFWVAETFSTISTVMMSPTSRAR